MSSSEQVKNGTLIDWSDIRELEGKLLTYVDATYSDKEQREAQKSLVRNTLRDWMYNKTSPHNPWGSLEVVCSPPEDADSSWAVGDLKNFNYSIQWGGFTEDPPTRVE